MNKEKINVAVRLRPITPQEESLGERAVVSVEGNSVFVNLEDVSQLSYKSNSVAKLLTQMKRFDFENCFGPETTTEQVYQKLIHDQIAVSMRGINSTVFLYGQTGSGKTFTVTGDLFEEAPAPLPEKPPAPTQIPIRARMSSPFKKIQQALDRNLSVCESQSTLGNSGPQKPKRGRSQTLKSPKPSARKRDSQIFLGKDSRHEGVLQMALRDIFAQIKAASRGREKFFVRCSYVEIYNESVFDLLRENREQEVPLGVYEAGKFEFFIKNAAEKITETFQAALEVLALGEANRHFAATCLNHNSSRSHTLFRVFFEYIDPEERVFESVCNFVDLAGSERLSRFDFESDADKSERIKESKAINKSLFFLTQIINMKSALKAESFIPYRNSPLTKILKNSIGGNAKTVIILCLRPSLGSLEQTLGTLRFGNLAKSIVNTVVKNSLTAVHENQEAIAEALRAYQEKISKLEESLKSGLLDSENSRKKIEELEEQKRLLLERYQSLVDITRRGILKAREGPGGFGVEARSELLPSCGLVDFYQVVPAAEIAEKGKRALVGEGKFFGAERAYTMEAFQSELVAAKQKRLVALESENLILRDQLNKLRAKNAGLENEAQLSKRLLGVFLNSNDPDTRLFEVGYLKSFVISSLQFIDNAKSAILNSGLRAKDPRQCFEYWENEIGKLKVDNLLKHFEILAKSPETGSKGSSNFDIPIIEKVKRKYSKDPDFHKKRQVLKNEVGNFGQEKSDVGNEGAFVSQEKEMVIGLVQNHDSEQAVVKAKNVSSDFLLRD